MKIRLEQIANGYLLHTEGIGQISGHYVGDTIGGAFYCEDAVAVTLKMAWFAEQHFVLQDANRAEAKEYRVVQRAMLKGKMT